MADVLNTFQRQFGAAIPAAIEKLRPFMIPWVQEFIRHAPFAVLASSDAQGRCDASPKGGEPGFVWVLDETHLFVPDLPGNRLFQSYANIEANPHIGLIFFIPGLDATARVNGRVEILSRDEIERRFSGEGVALDATDKTLQGLLLTVEEAYGHCPRALKFADVWNETRIRENKVQSPLPPKGR